MLAPFVAQASAGPMLEVAQIQGAYKQRPRLRARPPCGAACRLALRSTRPGVGAGPCAATALVASGRSPRRCGRSACSCTSDRPRNSPGWTIRSRGPAGRAFGAEPPEHLGALAGREHIQPLHQTRELAGSHLGSPRSGPPHRATRLSPAGLADRARHDLTRTEPS